MGIHPRRPSLGLSLCAGYGGLDLGLMLAEPGFHTGCFVEWDKDAQRGIIAAQRAGYFRPAPVWTDMRTFVGDGWRGRIDTILAGYPCQPFSAAGQRRGADDERHLWPDVARIAREVAPEWLFLENVAGHVSLGLETVLRDIWHMGYAPAAGLFSAAETGATHERLRVFIVAHRPRQREREQDDKIRADAWSESRHGSGGCRLRSGEQLAHADGGDSGAERQQRGGQFGFQPQGRGTGAGAVGNAEGFGRRQGRAEPEIRGGRDTASGSSGAMAHAICDARHEGRRGCWGDPAPRGTWEADRVGPSRPNIHPPGPSEENRWADILGSAPYLAPATSLLDCLAWAGDMAAALEGPGGAAIESRIRLLADGLAGRSRALRGLGNGVHPLAAGYAWRSLAAAHGLGPVDLDASDRGARRDADGPFLMEAAE